MPDVRITPRAQHVIEQAALRAGEELRDGAQRVAIDAMYETRNDGGTMHDAGAAAADAVLALLEPFDEHWVELDEQTFTITHPLTERAAGAMHHCRLHQWLNSLPAAPVPPGVYLASPTEPDTSNAAPWQLAPLDERNGTAASGGGST